MSKPKNNRRPSGAQESKKEPKQEGMGLGDRLDAGILEKLKNTSKALKQEEAERQEQEKQRRLEEARLREKNKSFAEMLDESKLDWKKYK
ncbi:YqkE family protein [Aneurinibacillus sp. Ricciae_BoGa-3]|uniref:YqkE family protein n=1 Tax=Aneurinibacillus sp. Ricciae_BoGa-3 TaxID=3022697 RepID=UPI0023425D22|nr:YqkE family protein [Aneurinibacillus sp. Ricciae_BoGa-3]WCK55556.1 YqkE family protein [Aneurinibacillus sp. Ricciae_BoGa-3]